MRHNLIGLAALAAMLALIVWLAPVPPHFSGWRRVVVQAGQSEWALALRYCPQAETRYVVDAVEARNHTNGDIQPGESLWIPTKAS